MTHQSSTHHLPSGLVVVPLETPTLGDRSYVVHDGRDAVVVDPQREDVRKKTGTVLASTAASVSSWSGPS